MESELLLGSLHKLSFHFLVFDHNRTFLMKKLMQKNTKTIWQSLFFFVKTVARISDILTKENVLKLYSVNQNKQGNKYFPKIEKVNNFFVKWTRVKNPVWIKLNTHVPSTFSNNRPHTTYSWKIKWQKCAGISGLWVHNEMIQKISWKYEENRGSHLEVTC